VDDEAETNIDLENNTYQLGRPPSNVYGTIRMLTANCGDGTTFLEKYGEYSAFKKALSMKPAEVVAEVKASGLVGRGGAAFPTGIKWEGAAKAEADQKYVICNADESEPGTFKDRVLLIDDPHMTIEGMCIAAYAIGATKGYIYIRGEYPYIFPVLEHALEDARNAGYLGNNFDIEIRVGAGAYICGEETALFESIEGKRGFPRIKPPFPTTHRMARRAAPVQAEGAMPLMAPTTTPVGATAIAAELSPSPPERSDGNGEPNVKASRPQSPA
jgi:NADH-quinone oxidoreductase subunit F